MRRASRGLGNSGNGPVVGYMILIRQFDLPDVTRIKSTRYGGNGPVVGYILFKNRQFDLPDVT